MDSPTNKKGLGIGECSLYNQHKCDTKKETKRKKRKKPSCAQNKENAAVICMTGNLGPDDSKDRSVHATGVQAETKDQTPPHPHTPHLCNPLGHKNNPEEEERTVK